MSIRLRGPLLGCFLGLVVLSKPVTAGAPEIYEQAFDEFNQQKYREAYLLLKTSLESEPGHLPSKLLMGKVLMLEGLVHEAGSEFEEALLMGADPDIVVPDLLQVYLLSGQYERVIDYDDAQLAQSTRADVALFKANAYDNLGVTDKAEQLFKRSIALLPRQRSYNSFAAFLIRNNKLNEASDYIDKASVLDANEPRTLHLKGMLAVRKNQPDIALEWFEAAHAQDNSDPVVKRSLVFAHIQLGNRDAARELLDSILTESENDPVMLLAKASLMTDTGESAAANSIIESLSNKLTIFEDHVGQSDALLPLIRGVTYYLSGQYQNSAKQLEQYLTLTNADKNSITLLARVYAQLNNDRKARELLEKHLELIKQDPQLTSVLCSLYIKSGKSYFCENLLKQVPAAVQQTMQVKLLKARLLKSQGKYPEAIAHISHSFVPPLPISANVELAQLHVLNRDPDSALGVLSTLLNLSPQNVDFLRMKTEILLNQNQLAEAKQIIQQIQTLAPDQHFSQLLHAKYLVKVKQTARAKAILEELTETVPQDPDVAVLYSQVLNQQGESEKASTHLEQFRKKYGANTSTSETLAMLYTQQGLFDTALKEVEDLRRNNIDEPKYIEGKINLLLKLNNTTGARQEIARLQQLLPATEASALKIAGLKVRADDIAGALDVIDRFASDNESTDRLLLEKANLYLKLNQPAKVIETVSPLIDDKTGHNAAYFLAAKANQRLGNWEAAYHHYETGFMVSKGGMIYAQGMFESAFNTARPERFSNTLTAFIADNPDSPNFLHYMLAEFYLANEQASEARQSLETYLAYDNVSYKDLALVRLARLEFSDNPQRGHQLAKQAFALSPNNPEVLATYGWSFALLEDYQSALYHLRESRAMASNNSETLYKLGYVLARLDKKDEALQHLDKARETNSPATFADKAHRFAQQLRK